MIVYPRLKQVERYPSGDTPDPAWQQALALLEVGFPSDKETFHARYELVSANQSEETYQFDLRPAAKEARRLLQRVRIEVSAQDFILTATELFFPDGSTMRNQFSGHQLNSDPDEALFKIQIDDDYRVVYPLQRKN